MARGASFAISNDVGCFKNIYLHVLMLVATRPTILLASVKWLHLVVARLEKLMTIGLPAILPNEESLFAIWQKVFICATQRCTISRKFYPPQSIFPKNFSIFALHSVLSYTALRAVTYIKASA